MALGRTIIGSILHCQLQVKQHTQKIERTTKMGIARHNMKTLLLRVERDTVCCTPFMQLKLASTQLRNNKII